MSLALSTTLHTSFADAVEQTRKALADQGFGVLTDIDMKATLKAKLGEDMEDYYLILGACNPPLAHRAVKVDRQIGLLRGGTSQIGTHRAPPSQTQRVNEAAALPSPAVMLSTRLDRYYDRLRLPPGARSTSRLHTGYRTSYSTQFAVRFGRGGLPSSRRHRLNVPRPLTPRSPSRLHLQDLHRFHGLHREPPGSALPQYLTTRQASLPLRTAQLLPPTGLSTLGFDPARFQHEPPACYRASWQLHGPDSHRQATTSFRSGHDLSNHLLITGRTGCSTRPQQIKWSVTRLLLECLSAFSQCRSAMVAQSPYD